MSWITGVLSSSIGKKVLVALSGLALLGFLFGHVYGNLHVFGGEDSLSIYAQHLHEFGWLLTVAEAGIIGAFVLHIVLVVKLTIENRAARGPQGYKKPGTKRGGFRYATSKLMLVSGLVVLTFLVVHIVDYRLERHAMEEAWHACMVSLGTADACSGAVGAAVIEKLQVPWRAALYILGSLFIGWHLFHGFQSAFRSFGFNSPKWTPVLDKVGMLIGVGLGVAFAIIPAWILISGGEMPFAPETVERSEILQEHALKSGVQPDITIETADDAHHE